MQQPLEDEYLKRKTTNPPKDPAKGSHENSEPPDNPARVTDGQNKKSLEAFITNNFEAFLRGSWRILNYQVNLFISSQLEHLQFRYYKTIVKQIFCLNRLLIVIKM